MKETLQDEFSAEQQEVLKSIRISRIILPILLGVGVVAYLFWKQMDPEDFARIDWTVHTTFWVFLSLSLLIIRHFAYAARLRILSEKVFSWKKCIELIFIWEFSSAVSPTSIGGSAVALVVLAQEKLSTAKTTTLVIYSAILDTIFFIGTLPILLFILGPELIRPDINGLSEMWADNWGKTFLFTYILMFTYGFLFFYGLFINPKTIKNLLIACTNLKWLHRFKENAAALGDDIILASSEMMGKKWDFHIGAFLSTATAWSCRFLLLNCLIIAFVPETRVSFFDQLSLYGRLEAMFVIMAFSPTPGGAGLAELVFGGFVKDFVGQSGVALIIASIWRLFTYYSYLFIGAIVIPNWIRNILNERKKARLKKEAENVKTQTKKEEPY